ncbi:hypothetical protein [Nonomuraea insulae]|uniref:Alpha/beta hydrolase family protein n=1 Tax=Nonomuraea insulae TaxID=1616787 RepID=A0ABW1D0P2_9ACTN
MPCSAYFGMSYGTYLGAVFTEMFPQRSDRFVLDSAIDPAQYMAGSIRNSGPANEAALDDWVAWTARRDPEYHLGTTARQVRDRVESLIKTPIRIGKHLVDERFLPMAIFTLLPDARENARLAARVRLLAEAADGKPVRPSEDLEQELQFMLYGKPQGYSSQAAVICGDAAVPRDPERYWRDIQRSRATQPVFGPYANNITACAFWPTPREPATRVGNDVPALIVQATGDTRHGLPGGREPAPGDVRRTPGRRTGRAHARRLRPPAQHLRPRYGSTARKAGTPWPAPPASVRRAPAPPSAGETPADSCSAQIAADDGGYHETSRTQHPLCPGERLGAGG